MFYLEKNKVYLIMLDQLFIKSIDYVENEYGKWKYSYNPTLLTSVIGKNLYYDFMRKRTRE